MRAYVALLLLVIGCGGSKLGANELTGALAYPVRSVMSGQVSGGCSGYRGYSVSLDEHCLGGRSIGVGFATADGGVSPGTYPIDTLSQSTCAQGFDATGWYGETPPGGGNGWVVGASSGSVTIDAVTPDPSGLLLISGSFDLTFTLPDGGGGAVSGSFDGREPPIACLPDGGP